MPPAACSLAKAVSGVNLSGAKAFVSLAGDPAKPEGWEMARVNAEKAIKALPGIDAGNRDPHRRARAGRGQGARPSPRPFARRAAAATKARHVADAGQDPLHHRRRLGQGRRRQIDDLGQSRARPRRAGLARRPARRRYLRPLGAASLRPLRQAEGRERQARAARGLWHQGHVDGLPRRRGTCRWSGAGRWWRRR